MGTNKAKTYLFAFSSTVYECRGLKATSGHTLLGGSAFNSRPEGGEEQR